MKEFFMIALMGIIIPILLAWTVIYFLHKILDGYSGE